MTEKQETKQRLPAVTSWNADYVEEMYRQWQEEPTQVTHSWQMFFKGFELAMCPRSCVASQKAHMQSEVASLMYAYRSRGHLLAKIDPLGNERKDIEELDISRFGFSESDLDQIFDTGHLGGPKRASLRHIIEILQKTYCGSIGVEYIHIQEREIRRWLQNEIEPRRSEPGYDRAKKLAILEKLSDAEVFEKFIHTHYIGQKRFSLEGAETLIAALHELVELAPETGVEEIVLGMAHRGRLNVLANILDKSYAMIFREFEDNFEPGNFGGDSDVKYHKGYSSDHCNRTGNSVHISLSANPSHLEAVGSVTLGKARAKQRQLGDGKSRKKVLPILIHGDSAFAGQGVVAETLNLSQLKGYRTGGTVHIIVNNQIGFTTGPKEYRSSSYCTDVAKMVEAPIFHVNGDDPKSTVFATEMALRFRQQFGRDVVVDMVCYRRHGHNESDEPAFTQPQMYRQIKDRPSVRKLYTQSLLKSGVISEEESEQIAKDFQARLQKCFEQAHAAETVPDVSAYEKKWAGLNGAYSYDPVKTAVNKQMLIQVAQALTTVPNELALHPKIARHLPKKMEAVEGDGDIDWSYAESLSFGTLLQENIPVRLSGQDSVRGTFSQRHCIWQDTNDMKQYVPLNHICEEQAHFCAYNSPLSEASVLGFDYGYSLAEPQMLILWEAQFGDFANGAQVIIDQFITCSQYKWQRTSGLVMLLPHGYEGQGPEHSNAYLERYLAACAQQNIAVCNLTTPAQYFHLLRRQMLRPFRRPLIIMAPKSLLRHKKSVSAVSELIDGRFWDILDDPIKVENPQRLLLCSGKIYYDLCEFRESEQVEDVALVRIEQLYPLNNLLMQGIARHYQNVDEIVWVQEEPKNRGAWNFIRPWLQYLFPSKKIRYIGRGYAASPATGSMKRHRQEQEQIVDLAIHGDDVPYDITILPEGAK